MRPGLSIAAAAAVLLLQSLPARAQDAVITGAPSAPEAVVAYDVPPRALRQPKPEYPKDAYRKKIQGTVLLEFVVDEQGRVSSVRVLKGVPGLNQAAMDNVESWRFAPATLKGVPVRTKALAPVSFCIEGPCASPKQ
jgi:periplasmic protein TonB